MNVGTTLVAYSEASELVEPGEGAFDDPTIDPEATAVFDPAIIDERPDVALLQSRPDGFGIVCLIGEQSIWTPTRAAPASPNAGNGVYKLDGRNRIVNVGPGQADCQRNAEAIRDEVPFRTGFRSISRVGACLGSPFTARIEDASRAAHSHVMRFWRPSSSRIACQRASQTPLACQSRSRRQHVTPDPQPIS